MRSKLLIIFGLLLLLGNIVAAQGVDTGQTHCYDNAGSQIVCPAPGEALFGQDANYQKAA